MSIDEPLSVTVEALLSRGRNSILVAAKSRLLKKAFNKGRASAFQEAALYVATHAPVWHYDKVKELVERVAKANAQNLH